VETRPDWLETTAQLYDILQKSYDFVDPATRKAAGVGVWDALQEDADGCFAVPVNLAADALPADCVERFAKGRTPDDRELHFLCQEEERKELDRVLVEAFANLDPAAGRRIEADFGELRDETRSESDAVGPSGEDRKRFYDALQDTFTTRFGQIVLTHQDIAAHVIEEPEWRGTLMEHLVRNAHENRKKF
jgi:hypothetical protein